MSMVNFRDVKLKTIWSFLLAVLLLNGIGIALPSCSHSFGDIKLPNKYYIARIHRWMYSLYREEIVHVDADILGTSVGEDLISRPGVVYGNITQYAVKNHFVVGRCEAIPSKDKEELLGYFVVDTEKHEVWKGLTEERFQDLLKEHKIEPAPEMIVLVDVEKLRKESGKL